MAYNLAPIGDCRVQFFTNQGAVLNGGLLYAYAATSTTPQDTYTDSTGGTKNSNPIVLDSAGRTPLGVYITGGLSYKFILKDSTGNLIWTQDVVAGINDSTASGGEWVSGPTPTYVSATSFTLSGDQTATFTVGRRVKTTNSGGTVYSTIMASAFSSSTTVTLANDSGTLDSGLSAVSYALLAADHPSVPVAKVNGQPVCNGRLTLTTATPVTTSDVTAATTVYFTPFRGDTVDLYDGSANWDRFKFAELSLAVPASTSQMYDVFLKNVSGTLTLSATAWTNDTTRATALTTQNGILVKSGDTASRYLGSFRTTAVSGQTEDSLAKRYVWNYYNRMRREMLATDANVGWFYSTNTWRQARATAGNQLDFVIGVSEDIVQAMTSVNASNGTGSVKFSTGIGLDSTSANSATSYQQASPSGVNEIVGLRANYEGFPGVGRHTLVWLEISEATGTTTWVGTVDTGNDHAKSGISGQLFG